MLLSILCTASATLKVEPEKRRALITKMPSYRCSVVPAKYKFGIRWRVPNSTKSFQMSPTDTSLLVTGSNPTLGTVSYECIAEALTVQITMKVDIKVVGELRMHSKIYYLMTKALL